MLLFSMGPITPEKNINKKIMAALEKSGFCFRSTELRTLNKYDVVVLVEGTHTWWVRKENNSNGEKYMDYGTLVSLIVYWRCRWCRGQRWPIRPVRLTVWHEHFTQLATHFFDDEWWLISEIGYGLDTDHCTILYLGRYTNSKITLIPGDTWQVHYEQKSFQKLQLWDAYFRVLWHYLFPIGKVRFGWQKWRLGSL